MAEVVLFHHVQGLTDGLLAFADQLREAGHVVHTPDLMEGARPATLEEGIALVQGLGAEGTERADRAVAHLPTEVVYAGFSWGVMAAQRLAQSRPGVRGALLYEACLPLTGEWGLGPWPAGVPVQVHGMDTNTGRETATWGCAIAWMPTLMINVANESRKGVAATESFRNEMAKQGAQAQQALLVTAQQALSQRGGQPTQQPLDAIQ